MFNITYNLCNFYYLEFLFSPYIYYDWNEAFIHQILWRTRNLKRFVIFNKTLNQSIPKISRSKQRKQLRIFPSLETNLHKMECLINSDQTLGSGTQIQQVGFVIIK